MRELASSQEYQHLTGVSGEISREMEVIAGQDFSQPQGIYALTITDGRILAALGKEEGRCQRIRFKCSMDGLMVFLPI